MLFVQHISRSLHSLLFILVMLTACSESKQEDINKSSNLEHQLQANKKNITKVKTEQNKHEQAANIRINAFINAIGEKKLEALKTLWIETKESDITDELLAALTTATKDSDARLAGQAMIVLKILTAQRENAIASNTNKTPSAPNPIDGDPSSIEYALLENTNNIATVKSSEQVSSALKQQALFDKNNEVRNKALDQLGLQRNDDASAVLIKAMHDEDAENRLKALKNLWYSAADGINPDGQTLLAIETATYDSDPQVAILAQQALKDLKQLNAAVETEQISTSNTELNPLDPSNQQAMTDATTSEVAPPMPKPISEKLSHQALYADDANQRRSAIQTISQSRSESATEILLTATQDTDVRNRRQAIKALWFAAADGKDTQGRTRQALEEALNDSDSVVAALARQALDDLDKINTTKSETITTQEESLDLAPHLLMDSQ